MGSTGNNTVFNGGFVQAQSLDDNVIHIIVAQFSIFEAIGIHLRSERRWHNNVLNTAFNLKNNIVKVGIGTRLPGKHHPIINVQPSSTGISGPQFRTSEIIVCVSITAISKATRHVGGFRVGIDVEIDTAIECQTMLTVFRSQQFVLDVEIGDNTIGFFLLPRTVGVCHRVTDSHNVSQLC